MLLRLSALLSLLLTGAIFGFFYAWVCSTMWGLDQLPAETAIGAMNAMNTSVRNGVFMPAFFGTSPALALTAVLAWGAKRRDVAALFALATVLYAAGAFVPTATVNVPMNQALMLTDLSQPPEALQAAWRSYSDRWQQWNQIRTAVSGLCLLLVGAGLLRLGRKRP
ncbi:DUF1772 domain-containing protein [Thalassovita taeanensis]|uniref:Uncharacterized membrane protein n=1 Tax=Thalassovita taeanensis TaxID=657014 RepID=A0A1H9AMN7_9RHOB|nr:anthrone oxygenase family protein [Thalassovita taeanensis]SEP77781.1 Uncharacterized membrane protein [Thalassovita taeanensis]